MSMRAYIITLLDERESRDASNRVVKSIDDTGSNLEPLIFRATTPESLEEDMWMKLNWTYPTKPSEDGMDMNTGLYLEHYKTANLQNRISCMVSHMRLWKKAIDDDEPIMVLEHDALFTRKFVFSDLTDGFKGGIVGLNDPRGATRKASLFHSKVSSRMGLQPVPDLEDNYPHGLAGNSAYIITPKGAKKVLKKVKEVGMWPNDAIMNRQFFPWMQVVYPYYTTIQRGLVSTTTS